MAVLESEDGRSQILTEVETLNLFYKKKEDIKVWINTSWPSFRHRIFFLIKTWAKTATWRHCCCNWPGLRGRVFGSEAMRQYLCAMHVCEGKPDPRFRAPFETTCPAAATSGFPLAQSRSSSLLSSVAWRLALLDLRLSAAVYRNSSLKVLLWQTKIDYLNLYCMGLTRRRRRNKKWIGNRSIGCQGWSWL